MTAAELSATPADVIAPRLVEDPVAPACPGPSATPSRSPAGTFCTTSACRSCSCSRSCSRSCSCCCSATCSAGRSRSPGISYVNYLMPGIFVQTVLFGSVSTGIGLAEDMSTGIIERFRSLPMASMAVLAGRTTADLVRNVFVVIVMFVVGFAVGFRPTGSIPAVLLGLLLVLAFAFALSWVFANVGLKAPTGEVAQAVAFPHSVPADVRLVGVRAGQSHARMAAGVRRPPARHHHHQCHSRAHARAAGVERPAPSRAVHHGDPQLHPAVDRLDRSDPG